MNARLPFGTPSCASHSTDPLDLTHIFESDIQIAEWCRAPDPCISAWLEAHCNDMGSGLRQTLSPGQRPSLDRLPPGAGREALADDLVLLAEMLGELLDATTIGLRLEVIHQAMCPRFHIDRVGIRLLCTYRGTGTQWLESAAVDRRFLGSGAQGKPDETSGLMLPGHEIQTLPAFSVALLKGTLWQGNADGGIVHRSPPVTDRPRILVAMDASWDEA